MKKKERKKMTKMTTKRGENHESGQIFQGLLSWSTVLLEIWFCWWFVTLLYAILTPFLGADDFLKDNIIILNAYQMISVIITGSFIIIIWIFFFFSCMKNYSSCLILQFRTEEQFLLTALEICQKTHLAKKDCLIYSVTGFTEFS